MAITYAAYSIVSNDNAYKAVLKALYDHFASVSTHWQLKPGATHAPTSVVAGDQGFVVSSRGSEPSVIAFGSGTYYGSGSNPYQLAVPSTAAAYLSGTSDQMLVGIDPSGTLSNLTIAGWNPSSRWSGWSIDAGGQSSGATITKIRIVEDAGWICVALHSTVSNTYDGCIFVGKMDAIAAKATAYCVIGGDLARWYGYLNAKEGGYESFSGRWTYLKAIPSSPAAGGAGGLKGAAQNDGGTEFEITKLAFVSPQDPATATETSWAVIGICPAILIGPVTQTPGQAWDDGDSNVIGKAMNNGCFILLDDNSVAW